VADISIAAVRTEIDDHVQESFVFLFCSAITARRDRAIRQQLDNMFLHVIMGDQSNQYIALELLHALQCLDGIITVVLFAKVSMHTSNTPRLRTI